MARVLLNRCGFLMECDMKNMFIGILIDLMLAVALLILFGKKKGSEIKRLAV